MSALPLWQEAAPLPSGPRFDFSSLPAGLEQSVWRAAELGHADAPTVSSGFDALDAELPGNGWPCRSLTEVLTPQPALCEWRLLGPALERCVEEDGQVFLVGPPKRPHAPGIAQCGVPQDRLIWFHTDKPQERLWTAEQLVKASPRGAILAWLPQVRPEQLRRLQVHAQSCECPVFLFRPSVAQRDASPAPLRVEVTLGKHWNLHARILKRKGAPHEGLLKLSAIPGRLGEVLPPRLLRPSADLVPPVLVGSSSPSPVQELTHASALGRLAPVMPPRPREAARH